MDNEINEEENDEQENRLGIAKIIVDDLQKQNDKLREEIKQARADERAKCLKGSFYRRTGTFYCEGCSFKCQASDCECICHKPLVQIAFNRGIKKGLSSAEESFAKRLKEAEKKAFSEGQADAFDVLIRRISSWGIELNPKDKKGINKKGIKMLNDVLDIIDEEASESLGARRDMVVDDTEKPKPENADKANSCGSLPSSRPAGRLSRQSPRRLPEPEKPKKKRNPNMSRVQKWVRVYRINPKYEKAVERELAKNKPEKPKRKEASK